MLLSAWKITLKRVRPCSYCVSQSYKVWFFYVILLPCENKKLASIHFQSQSLKHRLIFTKQVLTKTCYLQENIFFPLFIPMRWVVFWDRVSLCSPGILCRPGRPWTHWGFSALAFWVLGLMVRATMMVSCKSAARLALVSVSLSSVCLLILPSIESQCFQLSTQQFFQLADTQCLLISSGL